MMVKKNFLPNIAFFWILFWRSVPAQSGGRYFKAPRLTSDFMGPTTVPGIDFVTDTDTIISTANTMPVDTTTVKQIGLEINQTLSNAINETLIQLPTNNTENRFRWVDFGRHQPFPPYMPDIPGIPSGFRNPLANTHQQLPQQTPPLLLSSKQTNTPTTISTTTTTEENDSDDSIMYKPSKLGLPNIAFLDEEPPFNPITSDIRHFNMTRVEHIAAECSEEFMKVVVRFNGSFNGLIYSSGYVHDPNCIYINGTGRSYYEFFIRLNQCGTLGRQEMYHPSLPGEARRRDQVMWNTLSIQYNYLIEEEFDEHFRLTCEYGSDFWKTISFPAFNVEISTGSPVVFTINPPQCQMEIRRGFGIAGTRTSGPVTVGDPLTLMINMKSDKVGFDILVKNCIAHNGAQQRMQLIDSNGCVTNDKLISPFRGTYKSDNGHQVSLYAYLKAFRFTGSLALYLECDIHMCHNRCPPQRCYWRNLSKRSPKFRSLDESFNTTAKPILAESISLYQALEVHHEKDDQELISKQSRRAIEEEDLVCLRSGGLTLAIIFLVTLLSLSLGTSICFCLRMKKMKYLQKNILEEFNNKIVYNQQQQPQSYPNRTGTNQSPTLNDYSSEPYSGRFFRFY